MTTNVELEALLEAAAYAWQTDPDSIRRRYGKRRDSAARHAVIAVLREHSDYSLAEIGDLLSHSASAIALAVKRLPNYRRRRDWQQRLANLKDALGLY